MKDLEKDDRDCCCEHDHHEHDHGSCCCEHDHHEHDHDSCCCEHDHHGRDHDHSHDYPAHHDHDDDCCCGDDHHDHHDHDDACCHDDDCCCGHDHHDHHDHDLAARHDSHDDAVWAHAKEKSIYRIENLSCAHCAAKMEDAIRQLPGVEMASIVYATKQLRLAAPDPDSYLPEIRKICTAIESEVTILPREATEEPAHTEAGERWEKISLLLGAILFAVGCVAHHAGYQGTVWEIGTLLVAYLLLGGSVLVRSVQHIAHGQFFDENLLMSIATLGAFAIAEYPEAVGVMLFYRIGEFFEDRAVARSRSQIMEAVDLRPEEVTRIANDETHVIPAGEAAVGDILLIRPGDRIPLDGVIVEGESRLDTSPITGEPVPVAVQAGDAVLSGYVNTSGQLKLRVEKPLSESMVTRILDAVENAAASKPKLDRFITRFSKIYTPCVVLAAVLLAVVPSLVSGHWNYWIYTALTFLVMSCPCALVLSVPLAFFSGIGAGSRRGILFKGGRSIEALSDVRTVIMDKTGTLTEGHFLLREILPEAGWEADALLQLCASCEQHSTHPIAASITAAAEARGMALTEPESLEELSGHGIVATLNGAQVLCGNRKLMADHQIEAALKTDAAQSAEVLVAVDGVFVGRLLVSDAVKADAGAAVEQLRHMGLYTVMLTGDAQASAEAVAAELGIDDVYSRLLPQEKLERLTELREAHGSTMFIGDGINDAPVLAGADVGAAMGSGADAAIEAADAVFMASNVMSIPEAVAIARHTRRIAVQNVVFALVVKAIVMVLGVVGFANMWLAVFADTGVAMLCVLNSIRALYQKIR